jgi:hypothetical protein
MASMSSRSLGRRREGWMDDPTCNTDVELGNVFGLDVWLWCLVVEGGGEVDMYGRADTVLCRPQIIRGKGSEWQNRGRESSRAAVRWSSRRPRVQRGWKLAITSTN